MSTGAAGAVSLCQCSLGCTFQKCCPVSPVEADSTSFCVIMSGLLSRLGQWALSSRGRVGPGPSVMEPQHPLDELECFSSSFQPKPKGAFRLPFAQSRTVPANTWFPFLCCQGSSAGFLWVVSPVLRVLHMPPRPVFPQPFCRETSKRLLRSPRLVPALCRSVRAPESRGTSR